MKLTAILLLVSVSIVAEANNPYHTYLLSKIAHQSAVRIRVEEKISAPQTSCVIPRFERPKGAVFCRMEDYLTTKTKVWFKIGVQ